VINRIQIDSDMLRGLIKDLRHTCGGVTIINPFTTRRQSLPGGWTWA